MKSLLGWLVVLTMFCSGGIFAYQKVTQANRHASFELQLSQLKQKYQNKTIGLSYVDSEGYPGELTSLLNQYYADIEKLHKDFPEYANIRRELETGAGEAGNVTLTQAQLSARQERIDPTLALYEQMQAGKYQPLYTAADHGMRFDIVSIVPGMSQGHEVLRLNYVQWNAFGELDYRLIQGTIAAETAHGKPLELPQLVAENQPPTLQIAPERWVKEFLPNVELGYYELPKLPSNAKSISLEFHFDIHAAGSARIPVQLIFQDISVDTTWKLSEGQTWEADERYATDDELQRAGGIKKTPN